MEKYLEMAEEALAKYLPQEGEWAAELVRAVRYAVGAGGKRLRPILAFAAAEAAGGAAEDAQAVAAAIEFLHNYTLVHDDLPAMDNDRERRGKPTVWCAFNEANAILAGDALQALAFATLADVPRNHSQILAIFAARAYGVVAGQVEDVAHNAAALEYIYEHKTADLFMAAAECGALAAGADAATAERLREFARNFGIAFQYEDDLLDAGKKDDMNCLGTMARTEVEQKLHTAVDAACAALQGLPGRAAADFLATLVRKLITRTE